MPHRNRRSDIRDWDPSINIHDRVESPSRYASAAQAKIRARTTAKRIREAPQIVLDLVALNFERAKVNWKTDAEERGQAHDEFLRDCLHSYVESDAADTFATKMLHAYVRYGKWSDRQRAAIDKMIADHHERAERRAAERANAADAPEGKIEVEVVILKCEYRASEYSRYGGKIVITVKHETGWMAWGTLPRSINDADVGDTIAFSATFNPSDRDPQFAFFKRPTKARIVSRKEDTDGQD